MSKNKERLARAVLEIKRHIVEQRKNNTHRSDEAILESARLIGIAIQLAGKLVQEAAEDGRFLEISAHLNDTRGLVAALSFMLEATIGEELREIHSAEPEDFL